MSVTEGIRKALTDPTAFSKLVPKRALRNYQAATATHIAAVLDDPPTDALMVMIFSRQAGKDELLAQLVVYLLTRNSKVGGSIVVANPTKTPQADISYSRTLEYARTHPIAKHYVRTTGGYQIHIGKAFVSFVSAGKTSNARGQTASIALIANEAQDIEPDQWDAVFDPMAASTNAPTIFSGTIWTPDTLLSRQLRYAQDLENADGIKRVNKVTWHEVEKEIPPYGDRVRARIEQLGANHPFIRTEYELIELDAGATMFNAQRLAMLEGAHPRQRHPMPGQRVAFLIDVAGADEAHEGASTDPETRRDSTILTIVEVRFDRDLPGYRVLDRVVWSNTPWVTIEGAISLLMETWDPLATIIDATGIGHGMWQRLSALHKRRRIEAFQFSSKSKSDIGWQTLGIVDSGRVQDYAPDDEPDTNEHWWQLRRLTSSVRSGPNRLLAYGIPASVGHDDSVLSFMLIGYLDTLEIRPRVARGS